MKNKIRSVTAAMAVLGAVVASGAAHADGPEIMDRAGDANLINNQGTQLDPNHGPATPEASYAGADIRSIDFQTVYTVNKILRTDNTVSRVDYVATALKVVVTMEGDVLPTPGPSMGVIVPTGINGCETHFQAFWKGPGALPNDPQRTSMRKVTSSCGGDVFLVTGFGLSIEGKVITMTYPFASFTGSHAGFLAEGLEIGPARTYLNSQNNPWTSTAQYVQVGNGWAHVYATQIDQTAVLGSYTIGSDMPADVDCSVEPEHADCTA